MAYNTVPAYHVTPSSGGVITLPNFDGLERVFFVEGATSLLTLTINFPDSPSDGQRVTICNAPAIVALSLNGVVGSILGSVSSLLASNTVRYAWNAVAGQWFRA